MTLYNPGSQIGSSILLTDIAKKAAQRLGIELECFDPRAANDQSGAVHWMYNFDETKRCIYRIQNGSQQSRDIDAGNDGLIDSDDVEGQVGRAIADLTANDLGLEFS